jgi:hypothetical protein
VSSTESRPRQQQQARHETPSTGPSTVVGDLAAIPDRRKALREASLGQPKPRDRLGRRAAAAFLASTTTSSPPGRRRRYRYRYRCRLSPSASFSLTILGNERAAGRGPLPCVIVSPRSPTSLLPGAWCKSWYWITAPRSRDSQPSSSLRRPLPPTHGGVRATGTTKESHISGTGRPLTKSSNLSEKRGGAERRPRLRATGRGQFSTAGEWISRARFPDRASERSVPPSRASTRDTRASGSVPPPNLAGPPAWGTGGAKRKVGFFIAVFVGAPGCAVRAITLGGTVRRCG